MKNEINGEELLSILQNEPNELGINAKDGVIASSLEPENNKVATIATENTGLNEDTSESIFEDNDFDEMDISSLPKKFKNVESLVLAYRNLQAEFTKRSQKLKGFESSYSTQEADKVIENCDSESESDIVKEQNDEDSITTKAIAPVYEKEDWIFKVQNFLDTHSEAKEYASEISNLILSDQLVANSDNPLELAWEKIAGKNFVSKKTLSSDTDFLNNYVLTNQDLKEQIVKEYLENTLKHNSAPLLIKDNATSHITISKKPIFNSIKEAGVEVEKLFNN